MEPLEIHYKVHSYALKQIERLEKQLLSEPINRRNKFTEIKSEIDIIYAYLNVFRNYGIFRFLSLNLLIFILGVEQRGSDGRSASEFYTDIALDGKNADQMESYGNRPDDSKLVLKTAGDMVDLISRKMDSRQMCLNAFETIINKFPHYKACYRLAQDQFHQGNFKKCSDILFGRLFFIKKKRVDAPLFEVVS